MQTVTPAVYRAALAQLVTAQHLVPDVGTVSISALEDALHAASVPRFLRGGSLLKASTRQGEGQDQDPDPDRDRDQDQGDDDEDSENEDALSGGGLFSHHGNDDDTSSGSGSSDDEEDEDEAYYEKDDAEDTYAEDGGEVVDVGALLPRLGGALTAPALLYKGVPACQAHCTWTQETAGVCMPEGVQCTNAAAVRVAPRDAAGADALTPYLVAGAAPDPVTHSFFLCEAHHKYIWRTGAAKSALAAVAVVTLAGATVAALGPLAAAGLGLASSVATAGNRKAIWHAIRGVFRGSFVRRQAEAIAAATTRAGGQALVMADEAEQLLAGPSQHATRRLVSAYGGSLAAEGQGDHNDLVLLHAVSASGAHASGQGKAYVDARARATGMPGAVTALRGMVPALREVDAQLIAAAVNLGVNSSNFWRSALDGAPFLDALAATAGARATSAGGEGKDDGKGKGKDKDKDKERERRQAALSLLVHWAAPGEAVMQFAPASVRAAQAAGATAADISKAGAAWADAILRGRLLPAAAALRAQLIALHNKRTAKGEKDKDKDKDTSVAGVDAMALLQAALFGDDLAKLPREFADAVRAAAAEVKTKVVSGSPVLATLQPTALEPTLKAADGAVAALLRVVAPAGTSVEERAAMRNRVVDALTRLAPQLAAHRRLVLSESPLDALARLRLPDRLVLALHRSGSKDVALLKAAAAAAVARVVAQARDDAVAMAVLPTSSAAAPAPAQDSSSFLSLLGLKGLEAEAADAGVAPDLAARLFAKHVPADVGSAAASAGVTDAKTLEHVEKLHARLLVLSASVTQIEAAAEALAQVALARVAGVEGELAKLRAAAGAAPARPRIDKVAAAEAPLDVLARGDPARKRQLELLSMGARGFKTLPQWVALLDTDVDGYKAALPLLLLQATSAFADNHAAGAMDLAKTAAFLGLSGDDLLDVARLRARLVPILALLDTTVTPHRGVVELLRFNILMLLADGEFRGALAAAGHKDAVGVEAALAALEREFDAV